MVARSLLKPGETDFRRIADYRMPFAFAASQEALNGCFLITKQG
jgi:hypothetical protein